MAKDNESVRKREASRKAVLAKLGAVKSRPGSWLRSWRQERNMSQVDLAAALKCSARSIIRMEGRDELPHVVVALLEDK